MADKPDGPAVPRNTKSSASGSSRLRFRVLVGFLLWTMVTVVSFLLTQQYPVMYRNVHVPPTSVLDWFAWAILMIWAFGSLLPIIATFLDSLRFGLLAVALFTLYFVYLSLLEWGGILVQFLISVVGNWEPLLSAFGIDDSTAQTVLHWWPYVHGIWGILTTLGLVAFLNTKPLTIVINFVIGFALGERWDDKAGKWRD